MILTGGVFFNSLSYLILKPYKVGIPFVIIITTSYFTDEGTTQQGSITWPTQLVRDRQVLGKAVVSSLLTLVQLLRSALGLEHLLVWR